MDLYTDFIVTNLRAKYDFGLILFLKYKLTIETYVRTHMHLLSKSFHRKKHSLVLKCREANTLKHREIRQANRFMKPTYKDFDDRNNA